MRNYIFGFVQILLWANLLSAQNAVAESKDILLHAGSFSGELKCPHGKKDKLVRKKAADESLVPPDFRDLSEFPRLPKIQQQLDLGQYHRTDHSGPFRIGIWGDSHIASGYFTEEMIRALGLSPADVQPTFIPPTMAKRGVRLPLNKYCQGGRWSYEYAYTDHVSNGEFSTGLVNLSSDERNSYLWLDFRSPGGSANLQAFDLVFNPPDSGDTTLVAVSADNGTEKIVELHSASSGNLAFYLDKPVSLIKFRLIVGTLVLQGIVPHYTGRPLLLMDTLGIPGATVRGWKGLNTGYLRRKVISPKYDLVILQYGTNEGNDPNLDYARYAADLRDSLKKMRQVYSDSMCVLIGPTDRGKLVPRFSKAARQERSPDWLLAYASIHQRISRLQAEIGQEYGCVFWSWQDAMGGPGSAYYWITLNPALIAKDLTHLTKQGYQMSARQFVEDSGLSKYLIAR